MDGETKTKLVFAYALLVRYNALYPRDFYVISTVQRGGES